MLRDYVVDLINSDTGKKAFVKECDIFYKIHENDGELCNAYCIYRLFHYTHANDANSRIEAIATLQGRVGTAIDEGVLETVGILLKRDTYERMKCDDIDVLTKAYLIDLHRPLGYVSEEVKRCFTMHCEICDEDVESYIDTVLQIFIKIFFLQSEEVRTFAICNRMPIYSIIEKMVMDEADLNLMVQIKEIGNIVLEWGDKYV